MEGKESHKATISPGTIFLPHSCDTSLHLFCNSYLEFLEIDGGHDERLPRMRGGLADPYPRLLRVLPLGHARRPLLSRRIGRSPRGQGGLPQAEVVGGGLCSDRGRCRRRRGLRGRRVEGGRLELSEEESPDERPPVPRLGEGEDLRQAPHVVPARTTLYL